MVADYEPFPGEPARAPTRDNQLHACAHPAFGSRVYLYAQAMKTNCNGIASGWSLSLGRSRTRTYLLKRGTV
jgi:hypothetical protein